MSIKDVVTRLMARRRRRRRPALVDEDDRLVEKLVQSGVAANKQPPR
jgi:hypothetical protein